MYGTFEVYPLLGIVKIAKTGYFAYVWIILAGETAKTAEAIIEIGICQLMMNNLNNAQKTFERAFKIHEISQNVEGLCETRMHLAAVMQR